MSSGEGLSHVGRGPLVVDEDDALHHLHGREAGLAADGEQLPEDLGAHARVAVQGGGGLAGGDVDAEAGGGALGEAIGSGAVLVTGSVVTVGEARSLLLRRRGRES